MDTIEAARIINHDLAFWPSWRFRATPGDTYVYVDADIDTVDTSYPDSDGRCRRVEITLRRDFLIKDVDRLDARGLAYQILKEAAEINAHEDREALKLRQPDGTWRAPLHPHTWDGQSWWQALEEAA